MTLPKQVDVLVVGAGPTGFAAACALQQAGVSVLVVDGAPEAVNTSRAAVLHARTLEVLEDLDVTRRLLAEGLLVPTLTVRNRGNVLARIDFGGLPTAYPHALMLAQSRTEAILAQRLTELGGSVHRPFQAIGVTSHSSHAETTLIGPDAEAHNVDAHYVIGADGIHSAVRQAAGIGFTGGRHEQSFLVADVLMRWPLPPREVQLLLAPAGLVVAAPLPGDHYRIVATLVNAPERITGEDVQGILDERGPSGARVDELVWGSRFRVHHRVADSYRNGRVLLAGDAAHVHSPAGGQGMNTGIQDALDLAATLHTALRDSNPDVAGSVLDGYQQRRRPTAQHVMAGADRGMRMTTLTSPPACAARNLAVSILTRMPAVRHRLAMQLAGLNT